MGSFYKQRQRYEAEKMAKQVMETPKFKEALKEQELRATLNALARFSFMMCGFLETRHGYKKKGLEKFLKFVLVGLEETEDNSDFFVEYENYYIEEFGLDVLASLGLGLEKREEQHG